MSWIGNVSDYAYPYVILLLSLMSHAFHFSSRSDQVYPHLPTLHDFLMMFIYVHLLSPIGMASVTS